MTEPYMKFHMTALAKPNDFQRLVIIGVMCFDFYLSEAFLATIRLFNHSSLNRFSQFVSNNHLLLIASIMITGRLLGAILLLEFGHALFIQNFPFAVLFSSGLFGSLIILSVLRPDAFPVLRIPPGVIFFPAHLEQDLSMN
jgi:hypothetical protein